MLRYTIKDCWRIVNSFLDELKTQKISVRSLILYNSMVRGDFFDGRSDIDMMAVVTDKSEGRKLRVFFANFCKRHGCGDEPEFEKAKNLIPFQLFIYTMKEFSEMDYGIYYEDFVRNHTVLYGEEISSLIRKPDSKATAETFLSNALKSSQSWNNPPPEVMKRHLKWTKFYPAYLAIETIKAVLLYRGISDFNKSRLIKNIEILPNFREKTLTKRVLEIYLSDKIRRMSFDEVKQTYRQIHRLIRHVAQICKIGTQ